MSPFCVGAHHLFGGGEENRRRTGDGPELSSQVAIPCDRKVARSLGGELRRLFEKSAGGRCYAEG
jgi:hypothetical protein